MMEIHGKNMTGIDKSGTPVLHCIKPLRRRSNRRRTHRDYGTWLKARSQRTGKWTVEGARNVAWGRQGLGHQYCATQSQR